jgi:DNA-binding HxlR family transcriptional regulator
MLIVRDAFLGIRRFDDFQARTGIARNVLTARLEHLVEHGVLERRPYQERPLRHEYVLTDKGRDLWHVLTAMREWGDRWAAPEGPPVELVHRSCEHVTRTAVVCDHCREPLDARAVRVVPGPGARDDASV